MLNALTVNLNEDPRTFRIRTEAIRREAVGSPQIVKTISGAHTVLADDAGVSHRLTAAADVVWTLPNTFPEGWWAPVLQTAAGRATFTPAVGATVNSTAATDRTLAQWGRVIIEVEANTDGSSASWVVSGDVG